MNSADGLIDGLADVVGLHLIVDPDRVAFVHHRLDRPVRRAHGGGGQTVVDRTGGRGGGCLPAARRRPRPPGGQHRFGRWRHPAARRGGAQPRTADRPGADRRLGRPGDGRGGGGADRGARGGPGRRLGLRDRPGQPGLGHRRRDRGHQRRRDPVPALRRHPGPGGRPGGGARPDEFRRLPPRRAGEGQHRVQPARVALRQ